MSFATDLPSLYSDFGESCTIAGNAVTAIFDGGFVQAFDVSGTQPTLRCIKSTVASVTVGAAVVRAGVNYVVRGIELIAPDELETRLILERA